MYKLDLPLDLKENAAIERRRNREMQRQSRIFNARVRTIGVSEVVDQIVYFCDITGLHCRKKNVFKVKQIVILN